ncbi:MAG: outer membrane beta-barrel protein, partial [Flavobacterium sp.]
MKKLVVLAALLAFGYSNAQDAKSSDKGVSFGAKAGLNLSMLSGGGDSEIGFHIGGLAEFKFTDKISLQPELMFSTEGGNNDYNGSLGG